jgi:hypothetical protein
MLSVSGIEIDDIDRAILMIDRRRRPARRACRVR